MLLGLGDSTLVAPPGCTVVSDPDTGAPKLTCGDMPTVTGVVTPTQSCITDTTGKQVCGTPGSTIYTDPTTGQSVVVSSPISTTTILLIAGAATLVLLMRR